MTNLQPRRTEVDEALTHVSEAAREHYTYPFVRTEVFFGERTKLLDAFLSEGVRELAQAGLLTIHIELHPTDYDDSYRSIKEAEERIKDLPLR